jgi:hypothetical protein
MARKVIGDVMRHLLRLLKNKTGHSKSECPVSKVFGLLCQGAVQVFFAYADIQARIAAGPLQDSTTFCAIDKSLYVFSFLNKRVRRGETFWLLLICIALDRQKPGGNYS